MLADTAQNRSTRETAPSYDDAMRTPTLLLPLLLILADGIACKDDEPTGGEFGDPCADDPETMDAAPCGDDLQCFNGYCEETCEADSDCQPVDGFQHTCVGGLCHIYCDEVTRLCPQTLATTLTCMVLWCEGAS